MNFIHKTTFTAVLAACLLLASLPTSQPAAASGSSEAESASARDAGGPATNAAAIGRGELGDSCRSQTYEFDFQTPRELPELPDPAANTTLVTDAGGSEPITTCSL